MTYAVYVWSALAVFLLGLLWDWLAPTLKIQALKRQQRRRKLLGDHNA